MKKKILPVNCSPVRNGATAEIVKLAAEYLDGAGKVKSVCIDDCDIKFCKGCRACHKTAKCVQSGDDTLKLVGEFDWADIIVCVSPSYWADIPGQFKAFIDRWYAVVQHSRAARGHWAREKGLRDRPANG